MVIFEGLFTIWQNIQHTLANVFVQIFFAVNGTTNNPVFWSHRFPANHCYQWIFLLSKSVTIESVFLQFFTSKCLRKMVYVVLRGSLRLWVQMTLQLAWTAFAPRLSGGYTYLTNICFSLGHHVLFDHFHCQHRCHVMAYMHTNIWPDSL